jgi:hypothetical protein
MPTYSPYVQTASSARAVEDLQHPNKRKRGSSPDPRRQAPECDHLGIHGYGGPNVIGSAYPGYHPVAFNAAPHPPPYPQLAYSCGMDIKPRVTRVSAFQRDHGLSSQLVPADNPCHIVPSVQIWTPLIHVPATAMIRCPSVWIVSLCRLQHHDLREMFDSKILRPKRTQSRDLGHVWSSTTDHVKRCLPTAISNRRPMSAQSSDS